MKEEKKLSDYQPFLFPVVVALLVFLTAFAFLKPKIGAIIEGQRRLSQNKQVLARLTEKAAALEGLDQTELTRKTDILLAALPTEKDVPRFLATYKELAQKIEVVIQQIEVNPGKLATPEDEQVAPEGGQASPEGGQASPPPFLVFQIGVSGELEKVGIFLDELEKTLPLMRLKEVSLSQKEENLFESEIELQAFFLFLPGELGPVEEALPLISQREEEVYRQLADFKSVELKESLLLTPAGKENPFTF